MPLTTVTNTSAPDAGDTPKARSIVRRLLVNGAKLAVTVAVLVYILYKFGWRSIVQTIAEANPAWVAAAVVVFFVSGALGALQWQILLHNRGINLSYRRTFLLYFVGMFFNNFIFGMVAGDAVRVAYLRLGNESARAGFAATFLDRFAGLWSMCAFAVVAALWLVGQRGLRAMLWYVIAAAIAMFVVFAAVMAFLVSKRLQAWVFAALDRLPLPRKAMIRGVIEETLIEAHDKHILGPIAALSTVVQFMRVAVHVLCAAALGLVSLSTMHYFFIFVPILAVTMVIPLPFGVREGAEGSMFALVGFSPRAAVVMGFLASLVGIAVSLLGAAFFLSSKRHVRREPA